MKADMANPNQFLNNLFSSAIADGQLTALESESFVKEIQTAFSGDFSDIDRDNVKIQEVGDSFVINLDGQIIEFDEQSKNNVVGAIMQGLTQGGYR